MHWGISVKTKLTWVNKITVQKGDLLSCVKGCLALDVGAIWKPVCTWGVGLPVHCCSFQLCVSLCGCLRKHVGKPCCDTAPAKAVLSQLWEDFDLALMQMVEPIMTWQWLYLCIYGEGKNLFFLGFSSQYLWVPRTEMLKDAWDEMPACSVHVQGWREHKRKW